MRNDNPNMNYSAADIEKYWTGQLSAAEQHAMEKAALDDPFLADAMDGYENRLRTPQAVPADLIHLTEQLAARTNEKKKGAVVSFAWWKVAAVVVIVAGAGWLYTAINKPPNESSIAKSKPVTTNTPPPVAADAGTPQADSNASANALQDLAVNKPRKQPKQNNADAEVDKRIETAPPAPAVTALPEAEERKEENAEVAKSYTPNQQKETIAKASPLKKDVPASTSNAQDRRAQGFAADDQTGNDKAALANLSAQAGNTFNGNLTDASNKPLANAFVEIPNLNITTQTDNKGYFSFKAQDTLLTVSVESEGFVTQNLRLRNKAALNQIVLKPAPPSERDVVVQSNGAEKRKRSAVQEITIKIPDAEPVTGWDAYKEYLEKNKKVTKELSNLHGIVVVSFVVHRTWIGNYTIEQSLDEELDAEAIRLIKQGPAWKLLKGKKTTATVIVTF